MSSRMFADTVEREGLFSLVTQLLRCKLRDSGGHLSIRKVKPEVKRSQFRGEKEPI
jgi:hypothetical protein